MFNRLYKTRYVFFIISIPIFAVVFTVLILRAFFRPLTYIVRIEDSLFEKYVLSMPENGHKDKASKLPFTFKKLSETETNERVFGKIEVTAATISLETNVVFLKSENTLPNVKKYPLVKDVWLPCVEAGFENSGTAASVLSPDLSVSIVKSEDLPEKKRALPVDGLYAGDENYALTADTYAVCTVYENKIAQALDEWCEKNFIRPQAHKTVFIASVGDIMVARGIQDILINEKDGLEKVFSTTLPVLQNNDMTIGNLEGVVTDSSKKAIKTYTFKFKKAVLPFLKKAGFNYLMQANNHCYDYGEDGFKDTLAALAEHGIPTSGAGADMQEAARFYVTEIKGQKFALISCGAFPVEQSGFNGKTTATATETRAGILWESEDLLKSIAEQKAQGSFVIVNVHGGEEYRFIPSKKQRTLYESMCDSGADVVFGSHPHVLQPTERYKNSLIVYSLGNFLFNGMSEMHGATDSEIVRLGVYDGKILYIEIYPAKLKTNGVVLKPY